MATKTKVFKYEKEKIDLLKKLAREDSRTLSGYIQTVFAKFIESYEKGKK